MPQPAPLAADLRVNTVDSLQIAALRAKLIDGDECQIAAETAVNHV